MYRKKDLIEVALDSKISFRDLENIHLKIQVYDKAIDESELYEINTREKEYRTVKVKEPLEESLEHIRKIISFLDTVPADYQYYNKDLFHIFEAYKSKEIKYLLYSIWDFVYKKIHKKIVNASNIAFLKLASITNSFIRLPRNIPTSLDSLRVPAAQYLFYSLNYQYDSIIKCIISPMEAKADVKNFNDAVIVKDLIDVTMDELMEFIEYSKSNLPRQAQHKIGDKIFKAVPSLDKSEERQECLFRGAINNEGVLYNETRMRNATWGWPKQGRFNYNGTNYLYVADKEFGVNNELNKHKDKDDKQYQLACFSSSDLFQLIDLTNKDGVFIRRLMDSSSIPSQNHREDYILPNYFAWCLEDQKLCDGIKYRINKSDSYANYVFWESSKFSYADLGFKPL